MNRVVKLLLLLALFSGVALAQGSDSTAPPAKSSPNKPSNFTVTRTLSGSISSVDQGAQELVVKDSAGKLHTLKVADETRYPAGRKNLGLHDLHHGDRVKVTYRAADLTAIEVRLAEARPPRR